MEDLHSTPIEEQFKIMADTAPVLIWISGVDKLCYFFNSGWLRFTGRTMDQEVGNGWAEGVHPADFDRCLATYVGSFNERKPFRMEYRLKKHDREYRWVTDNGVPRYLADGTFAGYIGTCVDVHDIMEEQRIKTELFHNVALQREQELNEELASTNEEMVAANEELLASNDDLSAAQEQLTAMNVGLEEIVASRTAELVKSEFRYRNLVNGAPVAIGTLTGEDYLISSANELMLQIGEQSKDIIGRKISDVLAPNKLQFLLKILGEVQLTGNPVHSNEILTPLNENGELTKFYYNYIFTPIKDENGKTESIVIVANDVTEQVNSRKKIEYASNRLHSMVMTAPIGMTILQGRDLVIEIANQPMLEVWHRSKEEVIGKNLWDVFPTIKGSEFPSILANVFDSGKPYKISEILSPHPENEKYIDISYDPLFDKNGDVESILVTVIDITEVVYSRKVIENNQNDVQAINEELLSSNEELIATNDHLEKVRFELEESVAIITANEDRFRFMLNAIPQQVWTADITGALVYVNDVVCQDFGYNTEEIVGHGWQEFIHPDDLPSSLEKWSASLISGEEYMVEFRLKFADGTYHWHLSRALPLIENGDIKLWLGTNTNIDVQKQNEEMKDEFLSIASHELKTPLTSIKAFNQMMMRTEKSERFEMYVKKSSEQIYRLEKLIMDLLDVTKINAGKMNFNMEKFDFKEMMLSCIESMQHTTTNHQLVVKDHGEITYFGDRFRLEQVVHNFLSNAIKYSPKGEKIVIECRLELENIIVSIQDFGIGIAKDNLSKLFDRYYRVDNTAMRFDGLGLGLFISSEILKRHQGNFWIESIEGEGSTFYFGLPLCQSAPLKTIQEDDFYQDQHITIRLKNKVLYLDWTGFQNLTTVKHSALMILEMVKKYKVNKILNDNTNVLGTWSEASDWVGSEFFPMMEEAGLKKFAWVYSQSGFSQLSAQKSVDVMLGNVEINFFTDLGKAEQWLDESTHN